MPDRSRPNLKATALDPNLLKTPFNVQTNWHVITGAPSCGKTTLVDGLADQGYQTVPESARLYMEAEMAKGRNPQEIFENDDDERAMTDWQRRVESELNPSDFLLLDRAMPDYLAWWRVHGMDPNEHLPDCFQHRYASVFILDPLPFQSDEQRVQAVSEIMVFIGEWISRDYAALGYPIVRVPVLPIAERIAFVREALAERGFAKKPKSS